MKNVKNIKKQNNVKKENAITLIMLIIDIIVLTILTSVTIIELNKYRIIDLVYEAAEAYSGQIVRETKIFKGS